MLSVSHRPASLGLVRATVVSLLLLGTIGQLGWLAELVLDTGLSPLHTVPASLSAQGQPYREVFRGLGWVSGAAFVLASPPLLRLAPVHRYGRLTVAAMCALGVLLLLRAGFPPDCASLIETCGAAEDLSAAHRLNRVVSFALGVQYVAGPAVLALWWNGNWRVVVRAVGALQLAAGIVIVMLGVFASWRFVGLITRVQLVAMAALFGVGIAYLLGVGAGRTSAFRARRSSSGASGHGRTP